MLQRSLTLLKQENTKQGLDEEDSQIGVKIGTYFPTLKDYNGERTFFPKLFTNYI